MSTTAATLCLTQTSIGKKLLMAITGALLFVFTIGHMLGNLQIFAGPAAINGYAHLLHGAPALLWAVRGILLFCLLVHATAALATTLQSWRSRPARYQHKRGYVAATLASRTMRLTGPLLLLYVAYHLLHLTAGKAHPDFIPGDVYHNVISAFSIRPVAAAYVVAMVFLGLHLVHGVWSMFQTLGLNTNRWSRRLRLFAAALTALIVTGNISIPVAIAAGWLR